MSFDMSQVDFTTFLRAHIPGPASFAADLERYSQEVELEQATYFEDLEVNPSPPDEAIFRITGQLVTDFLEPDAIKMVERELGNLVSDLWNGEFKIEDTRIDAFEEFVFEDGGRLSAARSR